MKTLSHLALFFAALATLYSCDREESVTEGDLPAASREFLKTHFDGVGIISIVKETDAFEKDYTVYLANGFTVDFTKSGDWDEVDGKSTAIPKSFLSVLPQGVATYVAGTLPNCHIVEVNRERHGYEVGLSNGLDLMFNFDGEFVRVDD